MITRIGTLLLILSLLGSTSVSADERPPRYDLDGHCARLSNTQDGFSPDSMAACLGVQSDSLESIQKVWPGTPEYIQRDCDQRAKLDRDEDYLVLDRCIRDQLRLEQADKGESTRAKPKPPKPKAVATPPPN